MPNTISPPPDKNSHPPAAPPPAWDDRLLADPHAVADKRRRVREMFAAIAPSYDLNNRLHSLGVDQLWRRKAVKLSQLKATDQVVDVACGTGDLTLRFAHVLWSFPRPWETSKGMRVTGIDFTFEMLPIARRKAATTFAPIRSHPRPTFLSSTATFINGDAQSLPLPDACCDVVSIAFGIRNVQDPAAAFREFRRVLRPGGRVIVLEFSLPTNPILRGLYNGYFRHVLPRTATLVSGDRTGAYKYLPESVNTFIGRQQMVDMLTAAGFGQVEQFPMTFGVCVCYRGVVPA
jgi:demethylmenaquinone methyltransferase/2-methoxy-6-polyprenyl-1,4-benzoquinol methylase